MTKRLLDHLQKLLFDAEVDGAEPSHFELTQTDIDLLAEEAGMDANHRGKLVRVFGVPVNLTDGSRRFVTSKVLGSVTISVGTDLNG